MSIAPRQIGQSTRSNLLWQISKQLERLICVRAGGCNTTTTSTTTITPTTTTTTTPAPTSEWYEVTECYTTNVIYSVEYPVGTFQLNDGVTYYLGGDWTITNIFYTDPGGAQFGLSNIFQIGCPTTTTTTTTITPCIEVSFLAITDCPDLGYATVEYTDCNGIYQTGNVVAGSGNSLKVCTLTAGITPAFTCGDGEITYGSACTTTTTTTAAPVVNSTNKFVNCAGPCFESECVPLNYFNVWMTQACINSWPTIGCEVWLDSEGTIPFPSGAYNNGEGGCVYIENGTITDIP